MEDNQVNHNPRAEVIKSWFKDPYFLSFIGIMILAFVIRLYFFLITQNQAVWWDEGEYMMYAKHIALGTVTNGGWYSGREMITPYVWAFIYALFKNEAAIRFFQVIISTLTVAATYFLGKEVYDKKTGLIAALFMTFFWLQLFFTCRLLTYLYAPLLYTLALTFFWKGYIEDGKHKDIYLYLSFITITVGIGIYTSIALAAVTILLFLLLTQRFTFLKNKRLWKYGLLSLPLLLLSFIPSYLVQGTILPRLAQVSSISATETGAGLAGILTYINMMPRLMLLVYLVILILSLFLVLRIPFYIDLILKDREVGKIKNDLFIALAALIPFAFYTYMSMAAGGPGGAQYDAWILPVFPALFCLMASFIFEIQGFISKRFDSKNYRRIFLAVMLIILAIGFYQNINSADVSIKNKLPSYYNLKVAGEWLKFNMDENDIAVTTALNELTYYSEKNLMPFTDYKTYNTSQQFVEVVNSKKPKFLIWTIWEDRPDWVRSFITSDALNLTLVKAYFIDESNKNPDVLIYKINY